MADKPRLKTQDVQDRIAEKFSVDNGYACIFEVRDGAGHSGNRTIDVIVMNLWPSRGLDIWGIEIKASRSDWLREVKNPEKADKIFSMVNSFFVAVADKDIIKPGELPKDWGLLVPHGKSMKFVEPGVHKDVEVSRSFLAAMLKATQTRTPAEIIRQTAYNKGFEEGRKVVADDYHANRMKNHLNELQKSVNEFQEASGLKIDGWNQGKRLGELVMWLKTANLDLLTDNMKSAHDRLGDGIACLEKAVEDEKQNPK